MENSEILTNIIFFLDTHGESACNSIYYEIAGSKFEDLQKLVDFGIVKINLKEYYYLDRLIYKEYQHEKFETQTLFISLNSSNNYFATFKNVKQATERRLVYLIYSIKSIKIVGKPLFTSLRYNLNVKNTVKPFEIYFRDYDERFVVKPDGSQVMKPSNVDKAFKGLQDLIYLEAVNNTDENFELQLDLTAEVQVCKLCGS